MAVAAVEVEGFGRFAGFLAAWTYWIQGWTGHATIAVAAAGYAETLFGLGSGRLTTLAVAGAVLWLAVLNNLAGTRSVGAVAVATTVLKITALAIVAVAGLFAFHAGHVGPVRAHDGSWTALPGASALLLFSFLGMEGAAVATNREVVEVLHIVGAADAFIAREFQRRFLELGLRGAALGGGAAAAFFAISGFLARRFTATPGGDQIEAMFGAASLDLRGYAVILLLSVAVALLTGRMSRDIVLRRLRQMN